ncbi:MAG: MotA/TolQ/ExbB proton channel family protein [Victivallales bacterium]|nr:MotA/TolQ/ExbB proton channel family protein [Victivallales bacterium]MCF7889055.1 MotA/TolQ/ExbB proton channel family protein [Victivallales bacterium]
MNQNVKFFKKTFLSILFLISMLPAGMAQNVEQIRGKSSETLLALLIKGGPVMIPLLICSIVALTIMIERFISLRKHKIIPIGFEADIKNSLNKCTLEDFNKTTEFCNTKPSPISSIIKSGIARCKSQRKISEIEECLEDVAGREIRNLKGSLQGLKIIAAISPLLGLLGTVYGMITAFQTVANTTAGIAKAERLAEGIYEAMVTTATGLTIAIPVLLIYYFLTYKIDKQMNEIEVICDDFIDIYIANEQK